MLTVGCPLVVDDEYAFAISAGSAAETRDDDAGAPVSEAGGHIGPDAAEVQAHDGREDEADGPSCDDRIVSGPETDIDCGGSQCPPCADGQACKKDEDCAEGECEGSRCAVD
jgi:hypothetical protein